MVFWDTQKARADPSVDTHLYSQPQKCISKRGDQQGGEQPPQLERRWAVWGLEQGSPQLWGSSRARAGERWARLAEQRGEQPRVPVAGVHMGSGGEESAIQCMGLDLSFPEGS